MIFKLSGGAAFALAAATAKIGASGSIAIVEWPFGMKG